jgi:hypothetical protein
MTNKYKFRRRKLREKNPLSFQLELNNKDILRTDSSPFWSILLTHTKPTTSKPSKARCGTTIRKKRRRRRTGLMTTNTLLVLFSDARVLPDLKDGDHVIPAARGYEALQEQVEVQAHRKLGVVLAACHKRVAWRMRIEKAKKKRIFKK